MMNTMKDKYGRDAMHESRDNVLFILSNMGRGGIQTLTSTILKRLDELNIYNLYVFLFSSEIYYPASGKVINLDSPAKKNILAGAVQAVKKIIRINRNIKKYNINLIYTVSVIPSLYALISKAVFRFKTPLIVSYHNRLVVKDIDYLKNLLIKYLTIRLIHLADHVHTVSDGVKDELTALGVDPEKITTIHNAVDISAINISIGKDKSEKVFPEGKRRIITICRLEPQKNIPLLLNAFNLLPDRSKAHLVIAGEGSEKPRIENLIRILKIQDSVSLIGWRKSPFSILSEAEIFVLSSDREGFGNTIIEAMAAGVPVIAADCAYGPGEIITHNRNGLLVPPGDVKALSLSMHKLLNDAKLRKKLRMEGTARAKDFHVDVITEKYVSLFSAVMNSDREQTIKKIAGYF